MTDPSSDIGVVLITRNRRQRVLRTLDRLTALPERPPIVVVDNASHDGTAAAVRDRHPGVRVLARSRNDGAVARNHGVAALPTRYVAFSDDDSWWAPGALRQAVALFDAHPRLALAAAATRFGPRQEPDPLNDVLAGSALGVAPDLPGPSVLGFLACAAVVRRATFLDVGGFHPLLHFGAEESLLAIDLAAAGWGVAYCPQLVAHHHPDPGPRAGRSARLRRNELLTAYLRRPWPHALSATMRLAGEAVADRDARRALAAALLRLPAAVGRRRRVPDWLERDLRALQDQPTPQESPCPTPASPWR